jgi:hypothetical protein
MHQSRDRYLKRASSGGPFLIPENIEHETNLFVTVRSRKCQMFVKWLRKYLYI